MSKVHWRRGLAFAVMLVISWVPLSAAATAAPASSAKKGAPLAAFSSALSKLVHLPGGPPGAIAVVRVGTVTHVVSAGVANTTTEAPPLASDVSRIASVSKAYSGAVVLALVAKGKMSLDDTIGRLLPNLPKAWSAVTVAQLLQHTSGVPDYIKSPDFLKGFQANPQEVLTPNQLLDFVAKDPLLFSPGKKYHYSDSDNIVLGLMVEAVTAQTYEAALSKYVTTPLNLPATQLPASSALSSPYLSGYDVEAGQAPQDVTMLLNPGLAWASGGMVTTPAELNSFIGAYAAGKLTNSSTHRRQFVFIPGGSGPPGPGVNSSGLAIYRYATSCGTVYGHTGNFPGYTIFAASSANGGRSVAVIVNGQFQDMPANPQYTALRAAWGLGVCAALHS